MDTNNGVLIINEKAGRYEGVPNESYHKELLWAYSNSDLQAATLSPSNLLQKRNVERKDTPAFKFGRAMHARFEHFENESEYLKLVAVPPKMDKRTKEGKLAFEAFDLSIGNRLVLNEKEWDELEGMLAAVKAHPDANTLLNAKGINEETFIWQDKDTGVWCKCRPDKRVIESANGLPANMVLDWKTTTSCDKRDLEKSIADYNYHIQAAFYLDGISQVLGETVGPFVNVFIEKGGSNVVVLGVLSDASIERGRILYKAALERIASCQSSNNWWGFVDLSLPNWAA